MYIADSIIQAYLEHNELYTAADYPLMKHHGVPQPNRQDVVRELLKQLYAFCDAFPVFNSALWKQLFPKWQNMSASVLLLPVVGTSPRSNLVFQKEDKLVLQIDLLYIADFTRILSQMVYIMNNYLTKELALFAIRTSFPYKGSTADELLDYRTFVYGLANFLSWNDNCDNYVFHLEKYEEKKTQSFSALYQLAYTLDDKRKLLLLSQLSQADFWQQFPDTAGMFYLNDIYREQGAESFLTLVHQGYQQFVARIFHSPSPL